MGALRSCILDLILVLGGRMSEKAVGEPFWPKAFQPEESTYKKADPNTESRDLGAKINTETSKLALPLWPSAPGRKQRYDSWSPSLNLPELSSCTSFECFYPPQKEL